MEAIDLLKKMLEKDPKKRITINEIYNHPWIKKYSGNKKAPLNEHKNKQVNNNLKNLTQYTAIRNKKNNDDKIND